MPDDKEHPLLNRQIVYTGITRAKKRAVIVGTEKALTVALDPVGCCLYNRIGTIFLDSHVAAHS